jgi:hypothetical protein
LNGKIFENRIIDFLRPVIHECILQHEASSSQIRSKLFPLKEP